MSTQQGSALITAALTFPLSLALNRQVLLSHLSGPEWLLTRLRYLGRDRQRLEQRRESDVASQDPRDSSCPAQSPAGHRGAGGQRRVPPQGTGGLSRLQSPFLSLPSSLTPDRRAGSSREETGRQEGRPQACTGHWMHLLRHLLLIGLINKPRLFSPWPWRPADLHSSPHCRAGAGYLRGPPECSGSGGCGGADGEGEAEAHPAKRPLPGAGVSAGGSVSPPPLTTLGRTVDLRDKDRHWPPFTDVETEA